MDENDRVLVDSSIWIDFLRGEPEAVRTLGTLIQSGRVVICGQVRQEVLQGSRDADAFRKLEQRMSAWEYEAEEPSDFLDAARIFAELRWRGITVPPSDCLIAAVAKRCLLRIYASDPDFGRIPGIELFQ